MPLNTHVDTSDLEQVERPAPRVGPPLDLQPAKSPFFQGALPTTAVVNPDAVRNFTTPGIPSYRIVPAQPLNIAGATTNTTAAATTSIAPRQPTPAPTISQNLTSIPTGYQFAFLQVRLPMGSTTTISSYKVYRSTTNDTTTATVIQSIPHHPANVGVPVVVQDAQPNGATKFYFVSAINISGIESTLTPAQSGTVINNAALNSNSQLANSFHGLPLNTSWSPGSSTTLSSNGVTSIIVVAADTPQFGPSTLSYNSGTVAPGVFGPGVIFVDDRTFSGGAAIYVYSSNVQSQAQSDGRLLWGKITTSNTSSSSGGGVSGGSGGPTSAGGRGLILL
jgi:hypothetical protein